MGGPDPTDPSWDAAITTGGEPLSGSDALHCAVGAVADHRAVVVRWDFSRHGGSFGVADATAFVGATRVAIERRLPLVTVLRSGGTRLPEGMRALVGIPRAGLALADLRAAGLPHISVADHPTTGGVWVAIGSAADIRIAMAGALIGFSGPRVVSAMTGRSLPDGASTASSAYDAGLVDLVATPDTVVGLITTALAAVAPARPERVAGIAAAEPPQLPGDAQYDASTSGDRPDGAELLSRLLSDRVPLNGGDPAVAAAVGRIAGRPAVVVALAAERGAMPGPRGFGLLQRAAQLAGDLGLSLVVLVDTPGADPHTEADWLTPAIGSSLLAVLGTSAPTVSLVHGEGGSGGALAGAVTDVVGVGPAGWFAALGPVGAAAALRIEVGEASRLMRITPAELLADGLADEFVPAGQEPAWIATALDRLAAMPTAERLARRRARWAAPLPELSG
jgi:acetyl-CoA carboxylase carboxyl transferase subunit beta